MATPALQSALVLPKIGELPWDNSQKPNRSLTQVNPGGSTIYVGGTVTTDGAIDLAGFKTRDRELAFRDSILAQAINDVARRAATVFGLQASLISTPAPDSVSPTSSIATKVAASAASAEFNLVSSLGFTQQTLLVGNTLYTAEGSGGVRIFDVTQPTAPVLLSLWPTAQNVGGIALYLGTYLLVADNFGLQVLNVADSKNPTFVSSFTRPDSGTAPAPVVGIVGNTALLYFGGQVEKIYAVNIANPASPVLLGSYSMAGSYWAGNFVQAGAVTIFAGGSLGGFVFAAANSGPPAIYTLGAAGTFGPGSTYGSVTSVAASADGTTLFVAAVKAGVATLVAMTVDTSKLIGGYAEFTVAGSLNTGLVGGGACITVAGQIVLFSIGSELLAISAAVISSMAAVGSASMPGPISPGSATVLYYYCPTGTAGLAVVDISNVANMAVVAGDDPDKTPVARGSVSISLGGLTSVDDSKGNLVGGLTGTVDYVTGAMLLSFPATVALTSLAISWQTLQALYAGPDLDPTQLLFPLGSATGARHVDNSNVPADAITTDRDLYRRDLIVYEILSQADSIFVDYAGAAAPSVSPTVSPGATWTGSGYVSFFEAYPVRPTIGDAWSHAIGTTCGLPVYGQRWSKHTFLDTDRYLAGRDNILARYAAELSNMLASSNAIVSELQAICTEDDIDIEVENLSDGPQAPEPPGAVDENNVIFPDATAILPEQAVWKYNYQGVFGPLETATKLQVNITDKQTAAWLENPRGESTIVAVVGGQGYAGTAQSLVAGIVSGWDPTAIVSTGPGADNYYGANYATAMAAYQSWVDAGEFLPAVGPTDYSVAGSLANWSSYFGRPLYYRQKISQDLEIFVVHAAVSVSALWQASGNEGSSEVDGEPDGNSTSSAQAQWLRAALASSTATWKVVVVGSAPFASASMPNSYNTAGSTGPSPGATMLRWPFSTWGANLVLCGGAAIYERFNMDGLDYVNIGISGRPLDSATSTKQPGSVFQLAGSYGAGRLVANSNWLKFELVTVTALGNTNVADTFYLWNTNYGQVVTDNLPGTGSSVEALAESPVSVLLWGDTEYQPVENVYVPRLRQRDIETYSLLSDDGIIRTFGAAPVGNSLSRLLVYNKLAKTVSFQPAFIGDLKIPVAAAQIVTGLRPGQEISFWATEDSTQDVEWLRQASASLLCSPCHERVISLTTYGSGSYAPPSGAVITALPPVFYGPDYAMYEGLNLLTLNSAVGSQWFQLCFLVQLAQSWRHAGSAYDQAKSIGSLQAFNTSLYLPPASTSNNYQAATNSPTASWTFTLPTGSYSVAFAWRDLNQVPVGMSVSIRWNNSVIWSGTWTASAAENVSNAVNISSTGAAGTLSLTVNSPGTAAGFVIDYLALASQGISGQAQVRLDLSFYDKSGNYPALPGQSLSFYAEVGATEVVKSSWLEVSSLGGRSVLNAKLALLAGTSVPLIVSAVELRTRLRTVVGVEQYNLVDYRGQCLQRCLESLCHAWQATTANAVQAAPYTWDQGLTAAWLAQLGQQVPRLTGAFRPACPGDVGHPALVPAGLTYANGAATATLDFASAAPTLQPLQPWMLDLGLLVAHEDFWLVDVPPLPAKLIIVDPSGEDYNYTGGAQFELDFQSTIDSQYVALV